MTRRLLRVAKSAQHMLVGRPAGRTRCPLVGVGRQVRCSIPNQRCMVTVGMVAVGAATILKSAPLSVAVPRNIQNCPACTPGGQSPRGAKGNVSRCVMTCFFYFKSNEG